MRDLILGLKTAVACFWIMLFG